MTQGTLAVATRAKHTTATCGQSRSGGVVTSHGVRRSKCFGRVAVTHVQGSPKGGGALGTLEVTTTRLGLVPPNPMGVLMQRSGMLAENHKDSSVLCTVDSADQREGRFRRRSKTKPSAIASKLLILTTCLIMSVEVQAQGILEGMLKGGIAGVQKEKRQKAQQEQERTEQLQRISDTINIAPERACALPVNLLEKLIDQAANRDGLMDNISRSVFHENPAADAPTGYAAVLAKTKADTARKYAQDQAAENGLQVPVGDQIQSAPQSYDPQLQSIAAVQRIPNGLSCTAKVRVSFLRFPLSYSVMLDPDQPDGWSATWNSPLFTETAALDPETPLRIAYGSGELTLGEAREQSRLDSAKASAARDEADRQAAYRNSPAGRTREAAQTRALSADYKRRGVACQNSGGTWGIRWDNNTILEVTPGEVPGGIGRATLGCYHL